MPAPTAAATDRPVHPVRPVRPADPDTPAAGHAAASAAESAGDVVRWAVFCCVLVPVVLVGYGTSLGGATGTALGLAAVTAVCRLLLRRSERGLRAEAAAPRARRSHGGRNHRQG
ncbi:hypothetical protein [Streptomyces sp. NPDC047981]|uniref:hypothetical protein n=1 Tax=Streptomyces sp. NPDC047981 TaxID=3154610 RepID=UPI0034269695